MGHFESVSEISEVILPQARKPAFHAGYGTEWSMGAQASAKGEGILLRK